jgi:hypothetical protein
MPAVEIDQSTYDKLEFTARLLGEDIGAVIKLVVDRTRVGEGVRRREPAETERAEAMSDQQAAPRATVGRARGDWTGPSTWMPVHRRFKGELVEGSFNPATKELKVNTAPWNGKTFTSPTAAAVEVVRRISGPDVTPSTNGRTFWIITETGYNLHSVVGERQ